MPRFKAVFFDLDGTIVDTEGAAVDAIRQCLTKWKIQFDPHDARAVVGKKWEVALDLLFLKYPLPTSRDELTHIILRQYRDILRHHLPAVKGSVECIRALSQEYPLVVVSGSPRQDILFSLTQLGVLDRFLWVLGAEDYGASKPSPEGYLLALSKLGLTGDEVLVFEDSEAGITSAKAAGLFAVAVTGASFFPQKIEMADRTIEDFVGVDAQWVHQIEASTHP